MTQQLRKDYQICEEIGRGRYGTVFRCVSPASCESFAVKTIDKRLVSGDSLESQCLLTEPKILQLLTPHPQITQLIDCYEDDTHLHMVLELCPNKDLHQVIVNHGSLPECEARAIFTRLMQAIAHCHRFNIIHRDIKPTTSSFDSRNRVKLADFGSAEAIVEGELTSGVVGTPYYVAPEVLSGRDYGEKVDVWSAGVVLYIMLAGFPPFYGEDAVGIFEAVLRANLRFPSRVFQSFSPSVKDLLRRMLSKDVSRRFSAEQVLRHPWMTSSGGT
ncbi:phosphoenolpyruvate carboxylase kinase 1-like [Tripterygium wilfordii]|uniref:phosphoenolpyruvate carboxylase kinase 1-like n=1 Tax=Tripterygium wilfordii TaxID=458696 RepID=UPI0018F82456|nr:phosphoenolpyruvate carboxylase kinase 1-like [Tripterygium wilfordii]